MPHLPLPLLVPLHTFDIHTPTHTHMHCGHATRFPCLCLSFLVLHTFLPSPTTPLHCTLLPTHLPPRIPHACSHCHGCLPCTHPCLPHVCLTSSSDRRALQAAAPHPQHPHAAAFRGRAWRDNSPGSHATRTLPAQPRRFTHILPVPYTTTYHILDGYACAHTVRRARGVSPTPHPPAGFRFACYTLHSCWHMCRFAVPPPVTGFTARTRSCWWMGYALVSFTALPFTPRTLPHRPPRACLLRRFPHALYHTHPHPTYRPFPTHAHAPGEPPAPCHPVASDAATF